MVKSLRSYEGAVVEGLLSEGNGVRFLMRLEKTEAGMCLRVLESCADQPRAFALTLMIGLLKSAQFEAVLHAAAELGIAGIMPVICERSVPRIEDKDMGKKMERWGKIIEEASKVSGAVFPPVLHVPVPFSAVNWGSLPVNRFAALLTKGSGRLSDIRPDGGETIFAVGPEGDWSDDEAETLVAQGFVPISLGQRVLRASTAALVGCGWFCLIMD